jgi:hypothetical protein
MPCGEHATNVKGLAHALVSTSPHAPRLRPRLLSLVAIRFTILIPLSVITGATVFTIQSISPAVDSSGVPRDLHRRAPNHRHCGDVYSRALRAQTHCTSLPCRPLELEAKAPLTSLPLIALPQAHPSSCIHHFSHTHNSYLSCNRNTNSLTAANTRAHLVYLHCSLALPLHWPRWSATDTRTHLSPDFY